MNTRTLLRISGLVSGCCALALALFAAPDTGNAARARRGGGAAAAKEIAYLTLNLPQNVQWQRNDVARQGLTEWFVQGTDSQTSPMRVLYQKLAPAQPSTALERQITTPLKSCPNSRTVNLQKASQYPNQHIFGAYCSKMGQADFGLMSYVSIFSDGKVSHILLTEAKVPASAVAGKPSGPNAAQGQQFADLMREVHRTVRVCDKSERCI